MAHCNTRNALQHTATHCNTLQHTATHCNTLQHAATQEETEVREHSDGSDQEGNKSLSSKHGGEDEEVGGGGVCGEDEEMGQEGKDTMEELKMVDGWGEEGGGVQDEIADLTMVSKVGVSAHETTQVCDVLQCVAVCCNVLRPTQSTCMCLQQAVYRAATDSLYSCSKRTLNTLQLQPCVESVAVGQLTNTLQLQLYVELVAVGELTTHVSCNYVLSQLQ